ncbi:hypothetical protein BGW80DRAFT_1438713 [Lactifluus volemus]|nr:hypothetical protein BGW80DRAFT_1438713 [Lactifluus volemus]
MTCPVAKHFVNTIENTLGSAAVSTIVQKSGLNLPFSLGKKFPPLDTSSIWTLYDATKRDDGTLVSVFEFNSQQKRNLLPVAQNAVKKLRVTRHPDILKFMDAVEADGTIYIMTERVKPLSSSWEVSSVKQDKQDWILWGLHRITNALSFINTSCNAAHGTVRISSIFLSATGEWKLGGFELFSDPTEPNATVVTYAGDLNVHRMPENERGGWAALKDGPIAAIDAYALALLIFNLFNPDIPTRHFSIPPIPPSIWPSFKKLLNPSPKGRITPKALLDVGLAETVQDMTIKDTAPTLPPTFSTHLILPALFTSLTLSTMSMSAPSLIPLVIQLGTYVSPDEYKSIVLEPIVKLFANPDRGTHKLDKQTVSEKIWPHINTGFTDTVPVIRETTVKAIGLLSDKFTERILNNDLLRHLARLQSDSEPPIRTNSIILIGRLGPTLGPNTDARSSDNFPPARVAALMACMACAHLFDVEELAEKVVRDQAFRAVAMLVQILEEHAAKMPETALAGDGPHSLGLSAPNGGAETTLVSSAAGAAGALAGWAISSIGKKVSCDAPPPSVPTETRPSTNTQSPAPVIPNSSKPKAMQLGAHKTSVPGFLPGGIAEEARWGGDLMDVNADADDWSITRIPTCAYPGHGTHIAVNAYRATTTINCVSCADASHTGREGSTSHNVIASFEPSRDAIGIPAPSERAASPAAFVAAIPAPSTAGMTKEEKAAEMARRKEERRQRIAQLKEQKRTLRAESIASRTKP